MLPMLHMPVHSVPHAALRTNHVALSFRNVDSCHFQSFAHDTWSHTKLLCSSGPAASLYTA